MTVKRKIIVKGEHHPEESLVCGAILIKMDDYYIQYEECRLVPFNSKAGKEVSVNDTDKF